MGKNKRSRSTSIVSIRKSMQKYLLQVIVICIGFVIIINLSYMLMTWLIREVAQVENVYLSSEYQFLGTLIIALIILLILFAILYRHRKRELTTLSENIERVANGIFDTPITYNKRDSMAHVYQNFNKMSAELSNIQFLRKDFINRFSHEFKTPIASINGFASLMLEKELSPEEQTTYLQIIRDESERLSRLTSNTILLSKLSSLDYLSTTESYDLGEQLRQCSIILSHEWLDKKQEFSGDFPVLMYEGNRELMQHLWLNLIGNAVKYTPKGGEVSVSLSCKDQHAVIEISDTGQGMDSATLDQLFTPYFQGDPAHSSHGLGLGLSIANQIVNLCGGTIQVKSTLGEGSVFTVTLPIQISK